MQIDIDLPDYQLARLESLSEARGVSQNELVRVAIAEFVETHRAEALKQGFGLWADRNIDGLEYQNKLRSEW